MITSDAVARMLDYNNGIERVGSRYGKIRRDTRFGLNDVNCTGTELSLLECRHTQVQKVKATKGHYSFVLRHKTAGTLKLLALSALTQRVRLLNFLVLLRFPQQVF